MSREIPVDISQGDILPIGSRIRLRRHSLKPTPRLSTMARALDYNRGYLSHTENNRAEPSEELLGKISSFLQISLEDLQNAPLSVLAPVDSRQELGESPTESLTPPTYNPKSKSIGARIDRVVTMAHLSERETGIFATSQLAHATETIALIKSMRIQGGDIKSTEASEYNQGHLDLSIIPFDVDAVDPDRSTLLKFIVCTDLPTRVMLPLVRYSAEDSVPGYHGKYYAPLATIRDLYALSEDNKEGLLSIHGMGQNYSQIITEGLQDILHQRTLLLTDEEEIAKRLKRANAVFANSQKYTVALLEKEKLDPYIAEHL